MKGIRHLTPNEAQSFRAEAEAVRNALTEGRSAQSVPRTFRPVPKNGIYEEAAARLFGRNANEPIEVDEGEDELESPDPPFGELFGKPFGDSE